MITAPSLTAEEKTFLLNDAVFYEVLFALGVSAHDPTDYCVWEHLNYSRLGHARALIYFFERPSCQKKWLDDVISEDFGFIAARVPIDDSDRDRLNKDLFHLSSQRLRHTPASKPWPHTFLQQIHERSELFIAYLLSDEAGRDFKVDIQKWGALAQMLKGGRELCISRYRRADGNDSGWILQPGRLLPSGKSELTVLCTR